MFFFLCPDRWEKAVGRRWRPCATGESDIHPNPPLDMRAGGNINTVHILKYVHYIQYENYITVPPPQPPLSAMCQFLLLTLLFCLDFCALYMCIFFLNLLYVLLYRASFFLFRLHFYLFLPAHFIFSPKVNRLISPWGGDIF